VNLIECRRVEELRLEISALERLYGNYEDGRWGWVFSDPVRLLIPIPYKGQQGFFNVPDELIDEVNP
jgi:hypothetical protein